MLRLPLGVAVSLIVFLALARLAMLHRRRKVAPGAGLLWALFWLGVLALGWRPDLFDGVAHWAGVERGATLLFFLAILLLFYLILGLYLRLEGLQRDLTQLVRKLAMKDLDAPKPPPHQTPKPGSRE